MLGMLLAKHASGDIPEVNSDTIDRAINRELCVVFIVRKTIVSLYYVDVAGSTASVRVHE